MPKQRRMNKQARLELVRSYREEYMSAGRGRRGEILSCLQGSTNYNRKYLIRLLRGKYKHHARRKQRGRHYGAALGDVLRAIVAAANLETRAAAIDLQLLGTCLDRQRDADDGNPAFAVLAYHQRRFALVAYLRCARAIAEFDHGDAAGHRLVQ